MFEMTFYVQVKRPSGMCL